MSKKVIVGKAVGEHSVERVTVRQRQLALTIIISSHSTVLEVVGMYLGILDKINEVLLRALEQTTGHVETPGPR